MTDGEKIDRVVKWFHTLKENNDIHAVIQKQKILVWINNQIDKLGIDIRILSLFLNMPYEELLHAISGVSDLTINEYYDILNNLDIEICIRITQK